MPGVPGGAPTAVRTASRWPSRNQSASPSRSSAAAPGPSSSRDELGEPPDERRRAVGELALDEVAERRDLVRDRPDRDLERVPVRVRAPAQVVERRRARRPRGRRRPDPSRQGRPMVSVITTPTRPSGPLGEPAPQARAARVRVRWQHEHRPGRTLEGRRRPPPARDRTATARCAPGRAGWTARPRRGPSARRRPHRATRPRRPAPAPSTRSCWTPRRRRRPRARVRIGHPVEQEPREVVPGAGPPRSREPPDLQSGCAEVVDRRSIGGPSAGARRAELGGQLERGACDRGGGRDVGHEQRARPHHGPAGRAARRRAVGGVDEPAVEEVGVETGHSARPWSRRRSPRGRRRPCRAPARHR